MSLRRLLALIRALPAEATLWPRMETEQKKSEKQSLVDRLRKRTAEINAERDAYINREG